MPHNLWIAFVSSFRETFNIFHTFSRLSLFWKITTWTANYTLSFSGPKWDQKPHKAPHKPLRLFGNEMYWFTHYQLLEQLLWFGTVKSAFCSGILAMMLMVTWSEPLRLVLMVAWTWLTVEKQDFGRYVNSGNPRQHGKLYLFGNSAALPRNVDVKGHR